MANIPSTVSQPSFEMAMFGTFLQLGVLHFTWGLPDFASVFGKARIATVILGMLVWAASVAKGGRNPDPSIVDRLWSITPWCYCWYWYFSSPKPRLFLMASVATIWGIRLSWNFWRKGGYSGHEDYRWAEVRKWFGAPDCLWRFEIFNFVFICHFQLTLVFAQTLPCAIASGSDETLNCMDVLAAALFLLFVTGEHIADQQMFEFQTEKYRRKRNGEALGPSFEKGFLDTGLYAYSRHPNYFCEVAMWWTFYLFSLAAGGALLNWTLLGAMLLTVLFVPPGASLDTTEFLSSRKYPAYREYQKRVSRFLPWIPKVVKRKPQ